MKNKVIAVIVVLVALILLYASLYTVREGEQVVIVRFGEVLRDLRDLPARVVLAFPGEERGGKLHFNGRPDGGNYLAIKISPH